MARWRGGVVALAAAGGAWGVSRARLRGRRQSPSRRAPLSTRVSVYPRHAPTDERSSLSEWRFASYRAALESFRYFLILSGKDVVRAPRSTLRRIRRAAAGGTGRATSSYIYRVAGAGPRRAAPQVTPREPRGARAAAWRRRPLSEACDT